MLDGSPTHTRDATASPGFLLAATGHTAVLQTAARRSPARPRSAARCDRAARSRGRLVSRRRHDCDRRQFDLEEENMHMRRIHARSSPRTLGTHGAGHRGARRRSPRRPATSIRPSCSRNLTQNCVAAGPGGTFVGIGPTFTANAAVDRARQGIGRAAPGRLGLQLDQRLRLRRAADVLYVTDNADNGDFGISELVRRADRRHRVRHPVGVDRLGPERSGSRAAAARQRPDRGRRWPSTPAATSSSPTPPAAAPAR